MWAAEEKPGRTAGDVKFDDPSSFKTRFGGTDTSGAKEAREMKLNEDPARVTKGMNEEDDRDALIVALADNVVIDPENVHSVLTTEVTSAAGVSPGFGVEVTFNNTVGQTVHVDGILETLNMRDWRVFCDKFLTKMIESIGRDADTYDWPTPHPEVTKVPEEDGTDVIASVRVRWPVDETTWLAADAFVKDRARRLADETGEDTCSNCDAQIKYRAKNGRNVVTCPECGALNPLCGECTRPERERNACDRCKTYILCREMNRHMAEWR